MDKGTSQQTRLGRAQAGDHLQVARHVDDHSEEGDGGQQATGGHQVEVAVAEQVQGNDGLGRLALDEAQQRADHDSHAGEAEDDRRLPAYSRPPQEMRRMIAVVAMAMVIMPATSTRTRAFLWSGALRNREDHDDGDDAERAG